MVELNSDVILATAHLVGRTGATDFELSHDGNDAGAPADTVRWVATAIYRGARVMSSEQDTPDLACMALAHRLLTGAVCKCTKPITLDPGRGGRCRWRLMGDRWQSSCVAPPIRVEGGRGDYRAMQRAVRDRVEGTQ